MATSALWFGCRMVDVKVHGKLVSLVCSVDSTNQKTGKKG